ncbi:hypothetical protein IU459_09690 [Nocardia amamiensis]|uniref:Uncharacterized protein n=1 Tax=Nocardia amamiensis TaxID=404578 RepID=A0ABS0CML3_9NOCA|nr:hypothetical protein [Nocardia amamiensis]MBF6297816.1 hypothetical protein [Nocardia amamiensis]
MSLVIALTCGLLLFLEGPFDAIRADPSLMLLIGIFAALGLAILLRICLTLDTAGKDIARVDLRDAKDDDTELAEAAIREFNAKFAHEETMRLLDFVIDPSFYIMRISEQIDLGDEAYAFSTTQTIVGADEGDVDRLLVPILTPPKGELVDNLRISSGEGAVRTLSYRETLGALLTIGQIMVELVLGRCPEDLRITIRSEILRETMAASGRKKSVSTALHDATKKFDSADSRILRNFLHNFIYDAQTIFPIIAVVPARKEVKLKVGFTEDRTRVGGRQPGVPISLWEWFYSYIRASFGLVRRSHMIRLSRATRAQSYHLRTEAPEGMYVYDLSLGMTEVRETDSVQISSSSYTHRPIDPRWDCEDTRGLTYVHAYGRDLDIVGVSHHMLPGPRRRGSGTGSTPDEFSLRPHIPSLTIELREKPPGLMFVLVLLSVYLMALTIGVGYWHDLIFGIAPPSRLCMDFPDRVGCDLPPSPQSYWATILFGVPAIISGWLVSRFTSDAVSRISVSTLAVAAWFVSNSAAAMILSALKLARRLDTSGPVPILGTNQPLWSILMISSTGCAMMAVLLLSLRVRRYRRRSSGAIKHKFSRKD